MGASVYPMDYIQPTVKEVFKDLKDEPSDSRGIEGATKFFSRCL